MYNLELQGHEDAVVLAGDGIAPSWPPVVSCCIGKYLGPDFGFGLWTRCFCACMCTCFEIHIH